MLPLLLLACASGRPVPPEPAAAAPTAVRFAVTGDAPYDRPGETAELERLVRDVAAVDPDLAFLVHVGDLKRSAPWCTPATYTDAARALCGSPVPTFLLIGDNEFNDCPVPGDDAPDEALAPPEAFATWLATFGPEAERCPAMQPPFEVAWQTHTPTDLWPGTHTSAFAFDRGGVRFVGLAVPSFFRRGHSLEAEEDRVYDEALSWLRTHLVPGAFDAAVVFLHADVRQRDGDRLDPSLPPGPFLAGLAEIARAADRPTLVLSGDTHTYSWTRPVEGIDWIVVEQGGHEAPLEVTVDPARPEPFTVRRGRR